MKSSASLFIAAATVVLFSTPIQAAEIAPPNWAVSLTDTYIGCFTSVGGLKLASGKEQWQSVGLCQGKCKSLNSKYCALTKKFYCYCGDTLPPESAQVKNDVCNLNCAGYPSDPCSYTSQRYRIEKRTDTHLQVVQIVEISLSLCPTQPNPKTAFTTRTRPFLSPPHPQAVHQQPLLMQRLVPL